MVQKIFYIEMLRVVAAIAVVVIHVLGPYRAWFGEIPESDWLGAIALNGGSRWAVPVFIMITGALMLSDQRPFSLGHFVKRRASKVIIPFVAWSALYAALSGVTLNTLNCEQVVESLLGFPDTPTYYHLGFFYYFIPLYLLIPFLRSIAQHDDHRPFFALLGVWMLCSSLRLMGVSFGIADDLFLYGGYLLFGFLCHRFQVPWLGMLVLGGVALVATEWVALSESLLQQRYTSAGWFSYKTINTALIAGMVFMLSQRFAEKLSISSQTWITKLSRQSLGIYLVHPLFLWPIRELDWQLGMHWLTIPVIALLIFVLSYGLSAALSRYSYTAWLVP